MAAWTATVQSIGHTGRVMLLSNTPPYDTQPIFFHPTLTPECANMAVGQVIHGHELEEPLPSGVRHAIDSMEPLP